jgi:polar amino acid transport system substrate-binding protein
VGPLNVASSGRSLAYAARMRTSRRNSLGAALTLCIAVVAGCGSSSSSSSSGSAAPSTGSPVPTVKADPAVEKLVPAKIKAKGTLTVAADASYAPNEFIASDGHTVIGMDPDLVKALGQVMGLKANVVNVTFDAIIPGLAASKYDMGASSFTDTKEREKTVDFVTYLSVGEAFLTKAGSGVNIKALSDLCGRTVSVEKGTVEETDATTQNKKCKAAGKSGITLLIFPDQNGANLALASGRAQVDFADSPIIAYQVRKLGVQVQSGPTFGTAPYGLALPKGNGMAKAVLAALKKLMSDGTYVAILKRWQLQSAAIPHSVINGATS